MTNVKKKISIATITALAIAIALSMFSLPQKAYSDTDYAIGDTGPGGGKIFYIDNANTYSWDYLEFAPVDQGVSSWSNITDALIGTTESGIGTGASNTAAIIAQSGHTSSAAKLCVDYVSPTGYDDWFLPSGRELDFFHYNLPGEFPDEMIFYWSSTETGSIWAYRVSRWISGNDYKYNIHYVRAIRAGTGMKSSSASVKEPTPWVRNVQMTCYQVWVNEDGNFEFVFWWEYRDNNWVRIYKINEDGTASDMVFEIDMPYGNTRFEADLPDGFYIVKTFHDKPEPLQEFIIGKP